MKTNNEKRKVNHFAGILFLASAVLYFLELDWVAPWDLAVLAATLLMGIGLITCKQLFLVLGAGLMTVMQCYFSLNGILDLISFDFSHPETLLGLFPVAVWATFTIAGFDRKNAKVCTRIAALVLAVYYVACSVLDTLDLDGVLSMYSCGFDYMSVVYHAVVCVAVLLSGSVENLTGLSLSYGKTTADVSQGAAKEETDKFERLQQLKNLLDMGAITQEEFEQKKKEIINA